MNTTTKKTVTYPERHVSLFANAFPLSFINSFDGMNATNYKQFANSYFPLPESSFQPVSSESKFCKPNNSNTSTSTTSTGRKIVIEKDTPTLEELKIDNSEKDKKIDNSKKVINSYIPIQPESNLCKSNDSSISNDHNIIEKDKKDNSEKDKYTDKMIDEISNLLKKINNPNKKEENKENKENKEIEGNKVKDLDILSEIDELEEVEEVEDVEEAEELKEIEVAFKEIETVPTNIIVGYAPTDFIPTIHPEDDTFVKSYINTYGTDAITRGFEECKDQYVRFGNNADKIIVNNVSQNPIEYTSDGYVSTDITITGDKFNEIYAGVELVKLTNETDTHNGFTFVEGLNIDTKPFDYTQSYNNGLYFCRLDDIMQWIEYRTKTKQMVHMWTVTIPDDAKTVVYRNRIKTDKFILSNKRKISDYVSENLKLIANTESVATVYDHIDSIPANIMPKDENVLEQIYLSLVTRDPTTIAYVPENIRNTSFSISYEAATKYDGAYEYVKGYNCNNDEHEDIMYCCVVKNPDTYKKLKESDKVQAMADIAFKHNTRMYNIIPDDHKTIEMTLVYLEEHNDASHIPAEHLKYEDVIDKALAINGLLLGKIEFRFKTSEMCRKAVQNNGLALEFVPLMYVDYNMCHDAVLNSRDCTAYTFVPDQFRTIELKETMIKTNPSMIRHLKSNEINNNIIKELIKKPSCETTGVLNFKDPHIKYLFACNMKEYIDIDNNLHYYIPFDMFDYETALYLVINNLDAADHFIKRFDDKFLIDCVKVGVNVTKIPGHQITLELLNELVTVRGSIINELPERFLHDGLYVICMELHSMKLADVPEQFRTSRLSQIALNLYPEEGNFSKFVDSVITVNDIVIPELN